MSETKETLMKHLRALQQGWPEDHLGMNPAKWHRVIARLREVTALVDELPTPVADRCTCAPPFSGRSFCVIHVNSASPEETT